MLCGILLVETLLLRMHVFAFFFANLISKKLWPKIFMNIHVSLYKKKLLYGYTIIKHQIAEQIHNSLTITTMGTRD